MDKNIFKSALVRAAAKIAEGIDTSLELALIAQNTDIPDDVAAGDAAMTVVLGAVYEGIVSANGDADVQALFDLGRTTIREMVNEIKAKK